MAVELFLPDYRSEIFVIRLPGRSLALDAILRQWQNELCRLGFVGPRVSHTVVERQIFGQ